MKGEHTKNKVTNVFPLKRFKTPLDFFFSTFETNLFESYEQTSSAPAPVLEVDPGRATPERRS